MEKHDFSKSSDCENRRVQPSMAHKYSQTDLTSHEITITKPLLDQEEEKLDFRLRKAEISTIDNCRQNFDNEGNKSKGRISTNNGNSEGSREKRDPVNIKIDNPEGGRRGSHSLGGNDENDLLSARLVLMQSKNNAEVSKAILYGKETSIRN